MTNDKINGAIIILRKLQNVYIDYDSTDVERMTVADVIIGALDLAISAMKDLEVCRNELCLYCGQYKQRHLGACDGCRWYEAPNDYNQSQIQCHGC